MPKKATFTLFTRILAFSDLQILSGLGRSKSFLRSFFAFSTKIYPKNMYHTTKTQNFKFDLFDPVTLDDPDLTQSHKMLRMIRRSIPEKIHVVPSALFQYDTVALPSEASNDR